MELVQIELDMDVFNKRHDITINREFGSPYKGSPARKLLSDTTGISLGRSEWTGRGLFIITWEQYGKFRHAVDNNDTMAVAMLSAKITIIPKTDMNVFYGKGLNDE